MFNRIRALYFIHVYLCGDGKDGVFLTTAVLPLAIKYTVVAKWRSPADGVAGLGGLTVQAHCLSGYSHYPPPQPLAQLSLHQEGYPMVSFGKWEWGWGL